MSIFPKILLATACVTFSVCAMSRESADFDQDKNRSAKQAMTFMDVIEMRGFGSRRKGDISPDRKWFVYHFYVPDWDKGKRFSDIYITPLIGGKPKQITFTKGANERLPKWNKDSSFFAFLSNRSEGKSQIYFMQPDGGEAWQVTDDKFGVSSHEFSSDGKYLAYLGGERDARQIWIMPGQGGKAENLTSHKTPISSYLWNPNSKKIYFVAPDSIDLHDKNKIEKTFDAVIKNEIEAPAHLWEIDIETKEKKRLTGGKDYSVLDIVISDDGTKIAFNGASTRRFSSYHENDIYLLRLNTDTISRITNNSVEEWRLSFSPDSKWLAFNCGDDKILGNLGKIYIFPTEGDEAKNLLSNFDYNDFISYVWSSDSRYIYFTSQVGVDYHLFRVSIDNDEIKQITKFGGIRFVKKDKDSEKFLISYSDPENPIDYYYTAHVNFNDRDKWIKLTDAYPDVKGISLGKYETIQWKSTDDRTIEGLLIRPVNYREDRKYPLIVDIHGGPAAASINEFQAYVHVYAANGYVIFQPNYRGSSGYGEKFMKEIARDYLGLFKRVAWKQAFDDISTGVDYLIEREIVDPNSMGIMGWSFGGGLSNWALVTTDRFKAISTGASSLVPEKYIKNAKTPTLIHCGENDENNISQSEDLYVALRKIGVPTEFIVYPNTGHVIWNMMRYEMIQMQADFYWFEKWIKGKEGSIDWNEIVEPLEIEH